MGADVTGSTMDLILGEDPVRIEARHTREAIKTATMPTHPLPSLLPDGCRHPLGSQGLVMRSRGSVMGHLQSPRLAMLAAAAMEATTADTRRRHRPPRIMAPMGITGTNTADLPRLTTDAIEISGHTGVEGGIIEVAAGIIDRPSIMNSFSFFCMMSCRNAIFLVGG